MPELPEVERIRLDLGPRIIGRRVSQVTLYRRDIVCGPIARQSLLAGTTIESILRHGKQLAIVGSSGRAVCVHLGMTGQLFHVQPGSKIPRRDHVHAAWSIRGNANEPAGRLIFRDPRRFGGLWTFDSIDDLRRARWARLGPDALTITARQLSWSLCSSRRAIKVALLDQRACAGVGNIYADESLFRAGVHPALPCRTLTPAQWRRLVSQIRRVLKAAIKQGGSTIQNYVGGDGSPGEYQTKHQVYGRGGLPCKQCQMTLASEQMGQRVTVWCPNCQGIRDH